MLRVFRAQVDGSWTSRAALRELAEALPARQGRAVSGRGHPLHWSGRPEPRSGTSIAPWSSTRRTRGRRYARSCLWTGQTARFLPFIEQRAAAASSTRVPVIVSLLRRAGRATSSRPSRSRSWQPARKGGPSTPRYGLFASRYGRIGGEALMHGPQGTRDTWEAEAEAPRRVAARSLVHPGATAAEVKARRVLAAPLRLPGAGRMSRGHLVRMLEQHIASTVGQADRVQSSRNTCAGSGGRTPGSALAGLGTLAETAWLLDGSAPCRLNRGSDLGPSSECFSRGRASPDWTTVGEAGASPARRSWRGRGRWRRGPLSERFLRDGSVMRPLSVSLRCRHVHFIRATCPGRR